VPIPGAILGGVSVPPAVFERHGLRVERTTDEERLEARAGAWDRLALQAPQRLPRLSHAWTSSLLHHSRDNAPAVAADFGGEQTAELWCCLFASRGDELVGVLPMVAMRQRPRLGFARRAVSPPRGPRETCGDLLLAPGPDGVSALAALSSVAAETFPHPMCLELDQVYDSSPTLRAVRAGVPGMLTLVETSTPVSYLPIQGRYDDYRARLSAHLRKNLRNCRNRCERLAGSAYEFFDGPEAWRELDRFAAVEASGWKGREGSAIASTSATLAYYRSLTRTLAARGWLEFGFFRAEGRTLAAQMNVRFNRVVFGLRMAYDEGFEQLSPGRALFERSLQRAFESGQVDELNTGSDHAWQRDWQMRQRECWNVRVFPRRPLSFLLGFLPARLRSWARQRRRGSPS
jgi:hypothetical protein